MKKLSILVAALSLICFLSANAQAAQCRFVAEIKDNNRIICLFNIQEAYASVYPSFRMKNQFEGCLKRHNLVAFDKEYTTDDLKGCTEE